MSSHAQDIELIESSKSPDDAFSRFCAIMTDRGYNKVTYSLLTDHPSLGLARQHGFVTSYPEDWMRHYNDKGYIQIDPVVQQCMTSQKPFFWSDLSDNPGLNGAALKVMKEAEDAGLRDGVAVPLRGNSGEIVGVGLAREESTDDKDYELVSHAHMLSVYFHETFRSMLERPEKIKITDRESDILYWAAEGKTDDEISLILNISTSTVRFHWKNLFKKLGARGKIYAVTKAIRMQLIIPDLVRPTCQN
jgi:DNA-binding CsgD family transcriptional regulator